MKKIFLFLFLVYSYSFSDYVVWGYSYSSIVDNGSGAIGQCSGWSPENGTYNGRSYNLKKTCTVKQEFYGNYNSSYQYGNFYKVYYVRSFKSYVPDNGGCENDYSISSVGLTKCDAENGLIYIPNPEPNSDTPTCNELYEKDGIAYTCNPNTNESLPIDNSNGLIQDEDGDYVPNCNEGYDYVITQNGMSNTDGTNGMYNSYTCEQISNNNNDQSNGDNNTFPDAPTTSVGADGSTSWTWGDGTTQTLSPNGTLTTYYPDGTNSVKQVGNDYTPNGGGSSGGTATGGGGGAGTNGNTTNETDTSNNNDNPIDETPVSNSCSDSSLTLQEKMLCEMNAGMKKLNSETSPENSLNNLIKEMNKDNNTNATAINTNIKETNKILTDTKALNENQLSELKNVTKELKKLNATSGTSTSTITQPITDNFTPAENDTGGLGSSFESDKNLIDSFTDVYTDFKNNLLGHKDTLDNLITNTATTINSGIGLSLSTAEIINCPLNYNLDMTQTIGKNIAFNIDICEVTSKTKPYLYPIFLIFFTVGSVFFAFRFIGVLL